MDRTLLVLVVVLGIAMLGVCNAHATGKEPAPVSAPESFLVDQDVDFPSVTGAIEAGVETEDNTDLLRLEARCRARGDNACADEALALYREVTLRRYSPARNALRWIFGWVPFVGKLAY